MFQRKQVLIFHVNRQAVNDLFSWKIKKKKKKKKKISKFKD